MVTRAAGEPTATLSVACLDEAVRIDSSGRLPLSTSPRIGLADSSSTSKKSHARRGQHQCRQLPLQHQQARSTPRCSASSVPVGGSARKSHHRDSAEGVPQPHHTNEQAASVEDSRGAPDDAVNGSIDASLDVGSEEHPTSSPQPVGVDSPLTGSITALSVCSDILPSSSSISVQSLLRDSSDHGALSEECQRIATADDESCDVMYEDYAEEDGTYSCNAAAPPPTMVVRCDADVIREYHQGGTMWEEDVAEELTEEECSPIPHEHRRGSHSEGLEEDCSASSDCSPSSSSNHIGVVVEAALAAMQHGSSPYDSYDENDFCAYDDATEEQLQIGGSDLCNAIAAAEQRSSVGSLRSLLFHLQGTSSSSSPLDRSSEEGGMSSDDAESHSSCSLLTESSHPFTWSTIDIIPRAGILSVDRRDPQTCWAAAGLDDEPVFESPSVMSTVRQAIDELDERSANGDACASSVYYHPFLCLEAQQHEMRMHRSTQHYEYCASEVRKQEISAQDRVIMIKALLSEAHRHHTARIEKMGNTHLPLPPHRIHGLRSHAARVSGWRAIAAEVERSLVMEGPLMTQRKLSCMCIFNPHRTEAPASSPEGGDEERSRRAERQEQLLQQLAEQRKLFTSVTVSSFLPPEFIREGVHTPVFKPCGDGGYLGSLNSMFLSESIGSCGQKQQTLEEEEEEGGDDMEDGVLGRALSKCGSDDSNDVDEDDFHNFVYPSSSSTSSTTTTTTVPPPPSYMAHRSPM